MQIQHETFESIYTHDPNGYMVEFTRAMRPVTPQEDLGSGRMTPRLNTVSRKGAPDEAVSVRCTGDEDEPGRLAPRASRRLRRDDSVA